MIGSAEDDVEEEYYTNAVQKSEKATLLSDLEGSATSEYDSEKFADMVKYMENEETTL